jgi:hypothetical protein
MRQQVAGLRQELARATGAPVILACHSDPASLAFARRPDVAAISGRGPATPDHVIRTKRVPMVGRDVAAYARAYATYFSEHSAAAREPKTMLDPAPRVVIDPELGVCTVGRTAGDAQVVFEIYQHTMQIIQRAEKLGGWRALPAKELFEVEYWDLEQAKLRKGGSPPPFAGEVALVTGAASGIGKACVQSFLARGAAVVGLDIDPAVAALHKRPDFLGLACDVTDARKVAEALEQAVLAFGGLDMLVLNAGIFPGGTRIESLADEDWARVMRVNLDANLRLMRESQPLLKRAPRGGRVAVIGSKNVPAPQCGFRHRPLDRGGARRAGEAIRPHGRGVQEEQRAAGRGHEPRRGGAGGRSLRGPLREDHRRAGAGRWRQRSRNLSAAPREERTWRRQARAA